MQWKWHCQTTTTSKQNRDRTATVIGEPMTTVQTEHAETSHEDVVIITIVLSNTTKATKPGNQDETAGTVKTAPAARAKAEDTRKTTTKEGEVPPDRLTAHVISTWMGIADSETGAHSHTTPLKKTATM